MTTIIVPSGQLFSSEEVLAKLVAAVQAAKKGEVEILLGSKNT